MTEELTTRGPFDNDPGVLDVLDAWVKAPPGVRTGLYLSCHDLAAALDRLAALNA